jgi:surface protein
MFNQPLGTWNVDKVNNMSNMFCYASAFNQPLETWNVQNVTNMSHMFYDAVCFDQTLEHWKFQSNTVLESLHRSLNARHGSVRVLENTMEIKTWLSEQWRKHWMSIMIVVLSICIAVAIILWYSM